MTEQEKRDKVIRGLECCIVGKCEECEYEKDGCLNNSMTFMSGLKCDALALLKAQEPIAPIQGADDQDEDIFCCGSCGAVVGETFLEPPGECEVRDNYCPNCGQAVKWDG